MVYRFVIQLRSPRVTFHLSPQGNFVYNVIRILKEVRVIYTRPFGIGVGVPQPTQCSFSKGSPKGAIFSLTGGCSPGESLLIISRGQKGEGSLNHLRVYFTRHQIYKRKICLGRISGGETILYTPAFIFGRRRKFPKSTLL